MLTQGLASGVLYLLTWRRNEGIVVGCRAKRPINASWNDWFGFARISPGFESGGAAGLLG